MLELISHIIRTSAMRDRTEVNSALMEALGELFRPSALTIYRCFSSESKTVVFACAGIDKDGFYSRNAYLPDQRYCKPIQADPLLLRCKSEKSIAFEAFQNGTNRLVFPIIQEERLAYLIDVTVSENVSADRRVVLMGLAEYFGNHIALLDYGETDTLTGLANRKTFDKHLYQVLGQASGDAFPTPLDLERKHRRLARQHAPHWLAVCDIDHFKRVNDTFGHLIGDEVLVTLSQLIRESFRLDDQLFRFGGEEFIVVLQPTGPVDVIKVLERFRSAVEGHSFSRVGKITVSAGLSQLRPFDSPSDVIERADEALYYAKEHGRNQVSVYEDLVASGELTPKEANKGEIELF